MPISLSLLPVHGLAFFFFNYILFILSSFALEFHGIEKVFENNIYKFSYSFDRLCLFLVSNSERSIQKLAGNRIVENNCMFSVQTKFLHVVGLLFIVRNKEDMRRRL